MNRVGSAALRLATSRANVTAADGTRFPNTETFAVVPVTLGGRNLKVGILGVTIDYNPRAWVKYLPVIDSAKAAIAAMGPVDATVALTHLSLA